MCVSGIRGRFRSKSCSANQLKQSWNENGKFPILYRMKMTIEREGNAKADLHLHPFRIVLTVQRLDAMVQVANSVLWGRSVSTWLSWRRKKTVLLLKKCNHVSSFSSAIDVNVCNKSSKFISSTFPILLSFFFVFFFLLFCIFAVFLSNFATPSHDTETNRAKERKRGNKMKIVESRKEVLASSNEIYHLIPLQRAVHDV